MKLRGRSNSTKFSLAFTGLLLSLTSIGHAGTMGPMVTAAPVSIYFGGFGGAGAANKFEISQHGTAFFTPTDGGPLAVDAFGRSHSSTVGFGGAQVGFQWTEILSNSFNSNWGLSPAFELEGFYLGENNFTSHEINNNTARLPEHDFLVKYPMEAGVLLTNAVLNFNVGDSGFRPYVGAGIGGAVISIDRAQAIQVAPPELGVNHYNANNSDDDSVFAGQVKVGLGFAFNPHVSVFAEYRWLYLAASNYTFGSTVFPGHAATSPWSIEFDAQKYNLGAVGIRYIV